MRPRRSTMLLAIADASSSLNRDIVAATYPALLSGLYAVAAACEHADRVAELFQHEGCVHCLSRPWTVSGSSPHFSNCVAHRAAESGKSCFAISTCADSERGPM